jgi:hypothetical protein
MRPGSIAKRAQNYCQSTRSPAAERANTGTLTLVTAGTQAQAEVKTWALTRERSSGGRMLRSAATGYAASEPGVTHWPHWVTPGCPIKGHGGGAAEIVVAASLEGSFPIGVGNHE